MDISIIIPVYNEENNLRVLFDKLMQTLDEISNSFEIIFVDDKSTDNSRQILSELAKNNSRVKLICFRRNFGQTAAFSAGFNYCTGKTVITLDADLQNDPADIKKLLNKIDEGYDVVSGWRRRRKDKLFTRKIPSWIANRLISKVTGVKLHDFGCTLKAYKRGIFNHINLYGEMHRFIPAYAAWGGAKITEIEVTHHPRIHGETNYGLSRTFKVLLDLITVKFLGDFSTKPIYIFGGMGLFSLVSGFLAAISTVVLKFATNTSIVRTPLLSLSVLFILLGVQFILMGLLAELSIRIYHEGQSKPTYMVEKVVNILPATGSELDEKLVKAP